MIRLLLAFAVLASAAQKKAPQEEQTDEEIASITSSPAMAEKTRLELYLRERTDRIKDMHRGQVKFISDEMETWNAFWGKVKDDRVRFEVHVARQRLNLFESLGSLDKKDHAASILDFEKLQAKLVQSFEATQKEKVVDFFMTRDIRWKAFASQMERDRSALVADGHASWKDQKAKISATSTGSEAGEGAPRSKKKS